MTNKTREIWITKYALSKGIAHAVLPVGLTNRPLLRGWGLNRDEYEETEDAARRAAEDRRQKKLISLRKQIARLEATDFMAVTIREYI